MKEQLTTKVTVSGKGETKQQAFAAALSQVNPRYLRITQKFSSGLSR
ncbi:DUF4312 family protein [Vibrio anguillarum]